MNNLNSLGLNHTELQERINAITNEISRHVIAKKCKAENVLYKKNDYKTDSALPDISDFTKFEENQRWGGERDSHAWFYTKINVEDSIYRAELYVSTQKGGWDASNPQFMLYINGKLCQGMDTNHRTAVIPTVGENEIYLYAYTGTNIDDLLDLNLYVQYVDENVEKLYYNLLIPKEILEFTPAGTSEYNEIVDTVNNAINILDLRDFKAPEFFESVKASNEYLDEKFYNNQNNSNQKSVACIGHTHIDVAWKWTVRQTLEKAQRSFATVDALMDRYPEYLFMSSQVPLYKAVKKYAPELYDRIKKRVAEGRWEPEGGMYLEADCNLTGGEGLVRQFLYGKKFFKDEFNFDSEILWLPDVFGYSAALPQILKKCGVNDFVTSKISWNDVNSMPYDLFKWKGIDGSEVTTHFITAQNYNPDSQENRRTTYNAKGKPAEIRGTYERYQQKMINQEALASVGFGDGGGGTTPYDCEAIMRQKNGLPGQPSANWKPVKKYLKEVNEKANGNKYMPTWSGELYLEYHRGTYTSQAANKAGNRKSELLLQNVETAAVIGNSFGIKHFDKSKHDENWETVLLNQFHDILPGSSIKEVYEVTKEEYAAVSEYGNGVIKNILADIASQTSGKGLLVYNPNGFAYTGAVEFNGKRYNAENVPPKGYKLIPLESAVSNVVCANNTIENKFYSVKFDEKMNIVSIFDKEADREILKDGKTVRFVAYEDFPARYDAWEIAHAYKEKSYDVDDIISVNTVCDNDRAGFEIVRKFGKSTITEKVFLYDNEKRIEFDNNVDWYSKHILLKREFPLDLISDKASCEIQFGYADRPTHTNTSWDIAKYEVCAHKYVDVSESDYGVALINESKFGHSIVNNDIAISLLRGPVDPDPDCDMGKHSFKYALVSHNGTLAQSDVIKEAYFFNNPCIAVEAFGGTGELPDEFSFVRSEKERLVIDTVKPSEDGNGTVIRMYEPYRTRGTENITVNAAVGKAYLCDMLENELEELEINNGKITLPFKPFEIITVKIK